MGLIHLDAGVVIGFLDTTDVHHESARAVLAAALDAGDLLAMAASAFAESLVGPARRGQDAIATLHAFVDRVPISVIPLDADIATTAARLRAKHRSLRLPDALVIATGMGSSADRLVTTDHRWPSARTLGLRAEIERL